MYIYGYCFLSLCMRKVSFLVAAGGLEFVFDFCWFGCCGLWFFCFMVFEYRWFCLCRWFALVGSHVTLLLLGSCCRFLKLFVWFLVYVCYFWVWGSGPVYMVC